MIEPSKSHHVPRDARRILATLVAGLLLGLIVAGSTPVHVSAQGPTSDPVRVTVNLGVRNISKLDLTSGSYTTDFYVVFDCDRPCDPSTFELPNGTITNLIKETDLPTRKIYRVKAELRAPLNMREYPFEVYRLPIEIEDWDKPLTEQVYLAGTSNATESLLIAGWQPIDQGQALVETRDYPVLGERRSRYVFQIGIERPILSSVIKVMLPALILVLGGFTAFFMGPTRAFQRVSVTTATLLGSVVFHLGILSSIPPIGYLTFADQFLVINYLALCCSLGITVMYMHAIDHSREARAHNLYVLAQRSIFPIWLVFQSLNILFVFIF
jgi:hypothetical protein